MDEEEKVCWESPGRMNLRFKFLLFVYLNIYLAASGLSCSMYISQKMDVKQLVVVLRILDWKEKM